MKEKKISSLKSHDSHILMQGLIPLTIQGILPKEVCNALIELSNFFREICSGVLMVERINELELHISECNTQKFTNGSRVIYLRVKMNFSED